LKILFGIANRIITPFQPRPPGLYERQPAPSQACVAEAGGHLGEFHHVALSTRPRELDIDSPNSDSRKSELRIGSADPVVPVFDSPVGGRLGLFAPNWEVLGDPFVTMTLIPRLSTACGQVDQNSASGSASLGSPQNSPVAGVAGVLTSAQALTYRGQLQQPTSVISRPHLQTNNPQVLIRLPGNSRPILVGGSAFRSGFKIVILDEADAMTRDAQNALRRVIEKFTENTRFCIICNYLSKIIPALQSRCTRFRFGPLSTHQMVPRLEHVIAQEGINVTEDGMKAVVTLATGDMRKSLNILQSASMAYEEVNEDNVYTCVGHPLRRDIENIVNWVLNENFTAAYNNISHLKVAKGLALQDILTEVHQYVHLVDLPIHVRVYLLEKLADIEYRLASGTSEKIQLSSMIAAFQTARDLLVSEAK
ncbi:replication factor C subunit 5-like, partial [Haliotis rubra]|uniref:replication factor C subunit 5-like n=1 Tax=Haliotis rubra TaxID=36100 RepID=UPI001EE604D0